jgi:glycosyltransferase involved in cell wall biosynthesis
MRIVYVLTSLGMGGAERQVLALARRMAERGHAVALLVLRPRLSEEWPTTLDVFHLGMHRNPVSLLVGTARGWRFLRDFRPDLLHSHSFHANMMARLFKVLAPSTAVLSTIHNIYEGGWQRMLAYRLTDGLSRQTTAVSEAVAVRLTKLKAIQQVKSRVVTNGIDITEFSPSPDRRAWMRNQMGANGEFIWLAAGRIVPAKDFPSLLRAFARVRETCPEARLWIAGEDSDGGLKRAKELASGTDRGAMDSVRWLGLRRDMPALLDAADGFVLASRWEGMPLALGEALAMEKPVVATDVGGVRELVGETGLVVESGNSNALAAGMKEVMQKSVEDRHALGRAARTRIQSSFSMDAKVTEWEKLYNSLLVLNR